MITANKICDFAKLKKQISLKWVAESGELITVEQAVVTSFHGNGSTFNIKVLPSGEIRKVNRLTVMEINGEEVVL
ncbi:MAG: hypothetical protein J6O51_00880 [Bacteroidales bacterium]|nr:hypothetical protein [Bacteroidales bacterium]